MSRTQYRQFIGLLFFLYLADLVIEWVFPALVPLQVKAVANTYMEAHLRALPYKTFVHVVVLVLFSLLGPPIGLAGLFLFRRWARSLYTVLIFTIPLLYLSAGVKVSSWIGGLLSDWYMVGIGFALAAAWLSPLKEEFR